MADELQENVIRFITHYQAKLELENNPEREIVRILAQFAKVRMSPGYLKLTGVRRAIQPYLSWNGEIGSLAKGLEENWSKGGYQAPKTKSGSSNGSDSSPHSSGNNNDDNNHRSSHSSSSSNNNHRSSHSNNSSKSHRSSHGGSSSNNNNSHRSSATPAAAATAPADSAKERIKKRHGAEDPSSNPKKIKVDVEEQLFGSPALIKAADRGKDVAAKPTKPARKTEKAAAKAEAGSSSSSKNSRNGSKSGEAKPADSRAPKNDSSSDGGDADPDMRVMLIKKKHKAASSPGETTASGDRGKKGGKSRDSSSGSAAAASSPRKRTKKLANTATEEGFDASIASFEDVLGIPDYTRSSSAKRKKANNNNNNNNNPVSSTRSKVATEAPAAKSSSSDRKTENSFKGPSTSAMKPVDRSSPTLVQIKPILHDAASTSTLPEIQPNYKPLRFSMPDGGIIRPRKTHAEANEGSFFSSRHNRTQVFSGRRQASTEVPKLFDICLKTLQENINDLTYTGGIPCDILQPVFEKCSANQLYNIEYYNPYLVDDTGPLWEKHCEREFKGSRRGEHETWRDLYLRLMDERDAKLKRVTANISAAVAKTVPVRKTQLAFVDVPVKPERHVARQQAKMGTNPELGRKAVAASKSSSLKQQLAKPPPGADLVSIPSVPDPGSSAAGASQQKVVKKVAPLMQKTLKFMKNRFRR